MNKRIFNKKDSIAAIIARSRFVMRTELFDVKIAIHNAPSTDLPGEANEGITGIKDKRLIIAVPRRIGTAPARNRCRRRIKELSRTVGLTALPCDLIFFMRASCADMPANALRAIVEKVYIRVQNKLKKPEK